MLDRPPYRVDGEAAEILISPLLQFRDRGDQPPASPRAVAATYLSPSDSAVAKTAAAPSFSLPAAMARTRNGLLPIPWPGRIRIFRSSMVTLLSCAVLVLTGCTHFALRKQHAETKLREEARVLTTAVVDTLDAQPSQKRDIYTATALTLAKQDQRVEGLPVEPLDVRPLLESNAVAIASLEKRFTEEHKLIALDRKNTDRLIEFGTRKEEERNGRISFWSKLFGFGGLGVGGLIALMVFVPITIPILGRVLAWVVAKVPALAGFVGVVSTRAFDATVRGIEEFKTSAKADPVAAPQAERLLDRLKMSMDQDHKDLVDRRKLNL